MKKVAVIIKHPGRDWWSDIRIDICEVPEDATEEQIHRQVMNEMLGPFDVIGITEKIDFDRKLVLLPLKPRT